MPSLISSTAKKVDATGAGSARPVVSINIPSSVSARCWSLPSVSTKSPLTVQQRQPLLNSTSWADSSWMTSCPSMLISPNSLTMTANLRPCFSRKIRLMSVVFPAPRKPVTTVAGMRLSIFTGPPWALDMAIALLRLTRSEAINGGAALVNPAPPDPPQIILRASVPSLSSSSEPRHPVSPRRFWSSRQCPVPG